MNRYAPRMVDKHSMNPFAVTAWIVGSAGAALYTIASLGAAGAEYGAEDILPWVGVGSWAASIGLPAALILSGARWLVTWNDRRRAPEEG